MQEKVVICRVQRDKGYLYFVRDDGVYRVGSRRGPFHKEKPLLVHRAMLSRRPGFLYFVDRDGDISRAPMVRRGLPRVA